MEDLHSSRENLLDSSEQIESEKKRVSFFKLFRFTSKWDKLLLLLGTIVAVGAGLSKPFMATIQGHLMASFVNFTREISDLNSTDPTRRTAIYNEFHDDIVYYCYLWLILAVFTWITAFFQDSCFHIVGDNITTKLRKEFMRALLRQDVSWYDKQNTGALTTDLFSNLERVKEGTGSIVGYMVLHVSLQIGGFISCVYYDWRVTIAGLSLAPFLFIWSWYFNKKMADVTSEQTEVDREAGAVCEQALSSMKTVMYFNGQDHEISKYKKVQKSYVALGEKFGLFNGLWSAGSQLLMFSALGLVVFVGIRGVYEGEISVAAVLTIFTTIQVCLSRLNNISNNWTKITKAQVAAQLVYKLIDKIPEIDSYSEDGSSPPVEGRITIQNLSFKYPTRSDVPILKDVSFSVDPGQTVALVGASGSGKSTIVQLLLRFYDPINGRILIDGLDIDEYNIKYLRETIGVVSQEPILFNTTIEENIRYGRENITENQIWVALRKSNAYDFVKAFPKGLKTLVGDRGAQLSGGQKQRIAIARALVRDPKILLLDEATSALDAESETVVQEALENASKGRTTIVVAHRLSTIRNASKIIAMKHGEILETGTHLELMDKKGLYYDLVNNQVFVDTAPAEEKAEYKWSRSVSSDGAHEHRRLHLNEQEAIEEELGVLEDKDMQRLKDELIEENAKKASLWRIVKEAAPEKKFMVICVMATLLEGIIFPLMAFSFTELVQIFSGPKEEMQQMALIFFFMFLGMGVYYGLTQLTHNYCFGVISERLCSRLRQKVYYKLLRQDAAYFDKPLHSSGRLLTRLGCDGNNMKPAINSRLGVIFAEVATDIIGNGLSLYFCWKMALVAAPIFPLAFFSFTIYQRFTTKRVLEDEKEMENCGKIAMEAMVNIRTVHSLNLQKKVHENFCKHLYRMTKSNLSKTFMQSASFASGMAMYFFIAIICFRVGLYYIYHNMADAQGVLRSIFITGWASCSLGSISQYLPDYVKARMAAGLLFKMMDQKPEIDSMAEGGSRVEIEGNIYVRNLQFRYPERADVQVVKGVDLDLKQGQTVALVGASGCGKSTIVSLLERMYEPENGLIEIDGTPIGQINIRHLRANISIVSQEPILFDMTIKENILYGLPEGTVSHLDLIEAAKKANIHDFISCLPEAYGTRVGDKGTQLSGGQKQRIAIARALVRKPRILILDEATSALDTESEKHVQLALDQAKAGRSCLVIAHRLSTILNSDLILVFKDGQVAERGTHDQLIALKGVYYNLVQKQSSH